MSMICNWLKKLCILSLFFCFFLCYFRDIEFVFISVPVCDMNHFCFQDVSLQKYLVKRLKEILANWTGGINPTRFVDRGKIL